MSVPAPALPEVRPARPADATAIGALLRAAGLPHEDFAAHLAHFVVAQAGGSIVAAAGLEPHGTAVLLRSVVVAPAHRRAGLAGRLVEAVLAAARQGGAREAFLLTTTAEAYFARRGFARVARETVPPALTATAEFQGLCPTSAVCLRRALGT